MRVVYVTGWCRSGSTLLGNILGEAPGVIHVGELRYLWSNGVAASGTNSSCGCGRRLTECPLWSRVLAESAPDGLEQAAEWWRRAHARRLRTRHAVRHWATHRLPATPAARKTAEAMSDLYTTIARCSGAEVVVDTAKYPAEVALLAARTDIDLRVVHLVRDPRAVAASWRTPKAYIPAMSPGRSTAYWTGFNLASELVGRLVPGAFRTITYEDLCTEPAATVAAVMELAAITGANPVRPDGTVSLGDNHTVTGNPDRLERGVRRIRPDLRWHHDLPAGERRTVELLARPLLRRYRYVPGPPATTVPLRKAS